MHILVHADLEPVHLTDDFGALKLGLPCGVIHAITSDMERQKARTAWSTVWAEGRDSKRKEGYVTGPRTFAAEAKRREQHAAQHAAKNAAKNAAHHAARCGVLIGLV
jgi:hypothetical protein